MPQAMPKIIDAYETPASQNQLYIDYSDPNLKIMIRLTYTFFQTTCIICASVEQIADWRPHTEKDGSFISWILSKSPLNETLKIFRCPIE